MHVLVTGGAGYIGSHTIIELLAAGHQVMAVDNFLNSSPESLARVGQITGQTIPFVELDVCDRVALDKLFTDYTFDAVIHFAGLKAIGESVSQPLEYYRDNIVSSLVLCQAMQDHAVNKLVFSSSATVYGDPSELPLKETSQTGSGITNPYGWTKYMIEQMLRDIAAASPALAVTILRYFNPIGAHDSGRIGEDPSGIPNNLLPYVAQVAVGKLERINVFGDDYPTADGTGVRDYIHVVDLARGHVAALEHMADSDQSVRSGGSQVYNLGTGQGTSVLELIKAFEAACGKPLPYHVQPRRPGDIASCYADVSRAQVELGWQASRTIAEACADAWRWQSQNPNGYK